jgi:hypothetical protein
VDALGAALSDREWLGSPCSRQVDCPQAIVFTPRARVDNVITNLQCLEAQQDQADAN